ncbi:hypothetical protein [Neisseria iguanae]|uniref:Uncharacterized protein n=1 Tax=Neisseria iguanae TaxID=90242 RepID=A0A2P7TWW0_9NEIS|nr:hypothetical protein [Neisseria iguanae]PSJ79219.1 hypothetical protein C7N83_13560 [Neisseria iguanae]
MRTFFGVCLLVIGGWVLTLLDMLLFFDILADIRGMLFGILALSTVVLVVLGMLVVKAKRYYVLGTTLLLSAFVMWATIVGFSLIDSHPHWSRYLPTDFTESFSNLTLAFSWLVVQTLAGIGLMWRYRKA